MLVLLALGAHPAPAAPPSADASGGFARALLIAVFPLQGFEAVPVLAGSARGRGAIVIATLGSLSFACVLYALIQFACVSQVPDLARHGAPLAAAAQHVGGTPLMTVVSVGTNLSALATAFGMIVMTPRYVAALGREGGLSERLALLDERAVPRVALSGSALCIALLASSERVGSLFVLSSSAVLLQYVSAMASLGRLSLRSHAQLSKLWLLPACASVVAVAFLARAVEIREIVVLGATLVLGLFAWLLSTRARRSRAR